MNFNRPLILASNSPRRHQLLRDAGFTFEVKTKPVDETYPGGLNARDVATYLAKKKARAYQNNLNDEILITADTIVNLNGKILGKPIDADDARRMLTALSGNQHEVITGVCITSKDKIVVIDDITTVHFRELTAVEIDHYISNYKPFDKAGAYGIQEWIGMIGISKIKGSYFNVVGLPLEKVYQALIDF